MSHLLKKYSELETENGKLISEKDEAVYRLNKLLKMDNDSRSRVMQNKLYKNMKDEVKSLRKLNRKLKIEKEDLFLRLAKHNLKSK